MKKFFKLQETGNVRSYLPKISTNRSKKIATLEPIPQKWERMQVDVAMWMHPHTKIKYHILVVVDEGSRFRIARVLSSSEGNQATWEDMKKIVGENWFSTLGIPKVMKVDPAGPWMSQAATDYMDERNIEYVSIPAEAHWTTGIVESTIKTFKGILTNSWRSSQTVV